MEIDREIELERTLERDRELELFRPLDHRKTKRLGDRRCQFLSCYCDWIHWIFQKTTSCFKQIRLDGVVKCYMYMKLLLHFLSASNKVQHFGRFVSLNSEEDDHGI